MSENPEFELINITNIEYGTELELKVLELICSF